MSDGKTDDMGHFGGLITGFLSGLVICEQYDRQARRHKRLPDRFKEADWYLSSNSVFNYIGHYMLFTYLVGGLYYFYFYTNVNVQ